MKKKILIALFVIVALACMLVSCGECEHTYDEGEVTVAATCVTEGKKVVKCTQCGETKTETIAKNNAHTLTQEVIAPTCKEGGKTINRCTANGCTYSFETDQTAKLTACPAGDNIVEVVVTPATCTEAGTRKKICNICGKDYYEWGFDKVIPATGHTYEDDSKFKTDEEKGITFVAGNCDTEGYISRICQVCGTQDNITKDEYAALPDHDNEKLDAMEMWGHNFDTFVEAVAPNCTDDGYDLYSCSNPGCEDTNAVVTSFALGHTYVKNETAELGVHYEITLAPTCLQEGLKSYICTVCQVVATDDKNTEAIPTIDHNIVDTDDNYLVLAMDATCTEAAYKVYRCCVDSLCEETKTFTYGEALDHDWAISGEVNCSTGGLTPWKCNRCEIEELREDENSDLSIRHTYGSTVSAPTCVDRAVYNCSVCAKDYTSYEDDAAGAPHGNHVYDVFVETIAPICSAEGYTTYSCSAGNCGTTENREYTERTAHEFNPVTEDGRIVCVICAAQYRDVSTEITTGSGDLCLGGCTDTCTCGLKVEWNGYVSPKAPEQLTAGTEFVKTEVVWTEVGDITTPLALGEGMIVLNGTADTTYTIKVYDKVNGTLLATIERSGEVAFADLYKYAEVGQIAITASTDATVYFYAIVK